MDHGDGDGEGKGIEYLEVDGEGFEVRSSWGEPGRYEYSWLTGRNADYGFVSQTSDGRGMGSAAHETNIRGFLDGIDPATGYLAEESDDQVRVGRS